MFLKSFMNRNRTILAFLSVCFFCSSALLVNGTLTVRKVKSLQCLSEDAFVSGSTSVETLHQSLRSDFTLLKIVNDIADKHYSNDLVRLLKSRSFRRDTIDLESLKTVAALKNTHYPNWFYSDAVLDAAINRVLDGKCLFLTPFGNGDD